MAQLFPKWANTAARAGLVLALVAIPLGLMLAMGLVRSPYVTGAHIAVEQPVPFSHAHHAGKLNIDCRYCHDSVEESSFAGVPPTHTCMSCHSQLWTDAAALEPIRRSMATGESVRWVRVNDVADYVYFDHGIHVGNGVGCETCHGPVHRMPLTYAARPMFMGFCLDCHRAPERYLRPLDEVTVMDWKPPDDQLRIGRELIERYDIDVGRLTDCSICHR